MDGEPVSVEDAAKAMDGAIQRELSAMEAIFRAEMERCVLLIDGASFANGLAKAAQTWRRDLEVLADKVKAESESVSRALLGKGKPEIVQSVNLDLAAAVATDPERKR